MSMVSANGIIGSVMMLYLLGGCYETSYRPITMKVGEVRVFKPAPPEITEVSNPTQYKNVLMLLDTSGAMLDLKSKFIIKFFADDNATEPALQYSNDELAAMPKTTGCSPQELSYLNDAGPGFVLFCNNSFNTLAYKRAKFEAESGKKRTATMINVYYQQPSVNLVAVSIYFQ